MRHVKRAVSAMRSPHHHIKKGLTHPNRWIAAATWSIVVFMRLEMHKRQEGSALSQVQATCDIIRANPARRHTLRAR